MNIETQVDHTIKFARWRYENSEMLTRFIGRMSQEEGRIMLDLFESAFLSGGVVAVERYCRKQGIV